MGRRDRLSRRLLPAALIALGGALVLAGCGDSGAVGGSQETAGIGNPKRGKDAIVQYACASCHIIPGIAGGTVRVGPPLGGISDRKYIAGVLANTPENMVRWIRDPVAIDPLTAMPDLGVAERHARDMAAYLYTLD